MSVPLQRLQVHLTTRPGTEKLFVGECLWVPRTGTAAFEWSKQALDSGLQLAPVVMPIAPGVHQARHSPLAGIHPLFSDSIPDGFGLRLMNRGLADAGFDLADVTPLHRLAWVGEHGVGALTFAPAIDPKVDAVLSGIPDAAALASDAEAENFKDMPSGVIRAGGSALGARPKFWVALGPDQSSVIMGGRTQIPQGFIPCLLKFAPTGGDQNEPFLEAAGLSLARKYGVDSARGHLIHYRTGAALAVERFDRHPDGERIHTQSVAALLGLDFREPSLDYQDIARLTRKIAGEYDVERLYRQLCFNVALSMKDDHSKNFAFCMDGKGQWSLSPAFDLCPSTGIGRTFEHTTSIAGKGSGITGSDLEAFAKSQGLPAVIGKQGIDNARAAAAEFAALAVQLGATRKSAKEWAAVLKEIDESLQR